MLNVLFFRLQQKKSLLVIYKIVRLLLNTLSVDDKHYLLNRDNLTQPIQMKLSQKQKSFSDFFAFLKSMLRSMGRHFRWKKSFLVVYKILRLFVNALTADHKHYQFNRDNFTQPIQMQWSNKKRNNLFWIFFFISKIYIKFQIFSKKAWAWWLLYFQN